MKYRVECLLILLLLGLADVSAAATTVLSASFNTGSDGFFYSDDTFRGTGNPAYGSGNYDPSGGFSGGGVHVVLGGIDGVSVLGISGGWSRNFVVNGTDRVLITLRYRLVFSDSYESDECGQALVAVDGVLVSPGTGDYLKEYCGTGTTQDSGWRQVTIPMNLSNGSHTIMVGGWNSKKTGANEVMDVYFDDIVITQQDQGAQELVCNDGLDDDFDALIDCADPDCSCIFFDDFSDGNANGWTVVNDAGKASDWQVISGRYTQQNSRVDEWLGSYPVGSYSVYGSGFGLTDYKVQLRMKSLSGISEARDTLGIMFRYSNANNYYRFTMSRMQGFSRLEKRTGGTFSTLGFDGRGFTGGEDTDVVVESAGSRILVYVNGEPLFSVVDADHSSGSIALFTQSGAEFDDVLIAGATAVPKVVISQPVSYSVAVTDTDGAPYSLPVSAVAVNVPTGGGVAFMLDGGAASFMDFSEPYSGQFTNVAQGDHSVEAYIVNSSGVYIADSWGQDSDTNVSIGVGGKCFVGYGDSITSGFGDDRDQDNDSIDGRNINRGYTPVLNDLLSGYFPNHPITVLNEGLGGTVSGGSHSSGGMNRLSSTLARHSTCQYVLILFGTNDAKGAAPVMSGMDCTEAELQSGDPSCAGTYKENMRRIVLDTEAAGKVPLLGKVPYARNASTLQDDTINEYNIVIDQLVAEHAVPVAPPDFYTHFFNTPGDYFDDDHPNGNGYVSMANEAGDIEDLWFDVLIQSEILNCIDNDNDGYGNPGNASCSGGSQTDCDDNDPLEYPGQTWYKDNDNDAYSDGTATITSCTRITNYKALSELIAPAGDCNDNNGAINPGATEICGNSVDENCDGFIDACQAAWNDVIMDFGSTGSPAGVWVRYNDTDWVKLHNKSPEIMAVGDMDNSGQNDVIIDFGSTGSPAGVWVRYNDTNWVKLHTKSPEMMAVGDMDNSGEDDVIVDFGSTGSPAGVWVRYNDTNWVKLHTKSPEMMAVGDMDNSGEDDVIIDFGSTGSPAGVWVRYNDTNWVKLHTKSPEMMAVGDMDNSGEDDVIMDFGSTGSPAGVWVRYNDTNWVKLHEKSPEMIVVGDMDNSGQDDVIMDFGSTGSPAGVWVRYNDTNWVKLHEKSPEMMAVGDMDNSGEDDVIMDFGSTGSPSGVWVRYNDTNWVKLHAKSPEMIVTGNMDGS